MHLLRTNNGPVPMPKRGYVRYHVPDPVMDIEGEDALYALEHGEQIADIIDRAVADKKISTENILDGYGEHRWADVPRYAAHLALQHAGHLTPTSQFTRATTFVLRQRIEAEIVNRATCK